jgi:hypothetical protein
MWTEPRTGKRVTVWAFVMVLACSRHMFVRPVLKMDQQAWSDAHVAAFGFFDGVPARIVPDNLATGVTKADLYDPKINRSYAELAEHYRVLIDPARSGKPKDKPRVERPMPYVRALMTGLLGTTYTMNQASYDLGRLRLNGLIARVPNRNLYTLTDDGQRVTLMYTKIHDRLLRPLLAANAPPAPPELREALATIDRHVRDQTRQARLKPGPRLGQAA